MVQLHPSEAFVKVCSPCSVTEHVSISKSTLTCKHEVGGPVEAAAAHISQLPPRQRWSQVVKLSSHILLRLDQLTECHARLELDCSTLRADLQEPAIMHRRSQQHAGGCLCMLLLATELQFI
jgi:hypothetical protein